MWASSHKKPNQVVPVSHWIWTVMVPPALWASAEEGLFGIGQVVAGLGDVILHEFFPALEEGVHPGSGSALGLPPEVQSPRPSRRPQIVRPNSSSLLCHRDSAMAIGICLIGGYRR